MGSEAFIAISWGTSIACNLGLWAANYEVGRRTGIDAVPLFLLVNAMLGGFVVGPLAAIGLSLVLPRELMNNYTLPIFVTEAASGVLFGTIIPSLLYFLGAAANPRRPQN